MDLLDAIKEYWTIITGLVAIIIGYADLKSQNVAQEARIRNLETGAKELNPVLMEIRTKLASIEATLQALIREGQQK